MQIKFNNDSTKINDLKFLGATLVTPEIAKKLLEKNIGNRKINKKRVESYAKEMKSNNWYAMPDGLSITVDRKWNILNGQHRLNSIIESEVAVELFIFQKDIDGTAETVVCDNGLNRGLSMMMKVSTNYASLCSLIIQLGKGRSSIITVSDIQSFTSKLTKEEDDFITEVGNYIKVGFSAGIKAGFVFDYFEKHSVKTKELFDDVKALNFSEDSSAKVIYKFSEESRKRDGSGAGRFFRAIKTYGLIQEYTPAKIAKESFREETLKKFKHLYNEIMSRN